MAAKLAGSPPPGLINADPESVPEGYASVDLAAADGLGHLGWTFARCGVRRCVVPCFSRTLCTNQK
jgi:hypothetical protein